MGMGIIQTGLSRIDECYYFPQRYVRPHRFKNASLLLFADIFYLLDATKLDIKSFKSTMKDFKLPNKKLDELIATEIIDKT